MGYGIQSLSFLGMGAGEGANHLSLVTYPEYASAVAAMIDELILAAFKTRQGALNRTCTPRTFQAPASAMYL